ncbi:UNVERIFIED_CONTAM: hypothetical protein FKN15_029299 [Acipenser sinensis]
MADKPKRRNQSLIAPGSQETPLPDVRFYRSPNLPRTSARTSPGPPTADRPTPSMNLERSGAKKMAVRKRTLRPLAISWDLDLDSTGEWIVQGVPTRHSKAVT